MSEAFNHRVGADCAVTFAPAKLNLHLEVLGKRPDGYHALETVMLSIDLFDTIEARRTSGDIALSVENAAIPADASNLVWKAAVLLQSTTHTSFGASIRLTKRIPSEAGLGGGSSDAALTLRLLSELWNLNLPIDMLSDLAKQLGSDVGFFLHDSAALCTGRGEIVEPIYVAEPLHFVLVKPEVGANTAKVFAALTLLSTRGEGSKSKSLVDALVHSNLSHIAASLFNRLQTSAFGLHPQIKSVYECLNRTEALGVLMSGSGSSVFALCADRLAAQRVQQEFRRQILTLRISCQSYIVRSLGHMPR